MVWHIRPGLKRSRGASGWSQVVESGDAVGLVGLVGDIGTLIEVL